MTLIAALRNPSSPVSAFLDRHFPATEPFLRRRAPDLARSPTRFPVSQESPWVLQSAFRYRVRMALGFTPFEELAAARGLARLGRRVDPRLGEELAHLYPRVLRSVRPWERAPTGKEERQLGQLALLLALVDLPETVHRDALDPRIARAGAARTGLRGLIALLEPGWLEDLTGLTRVFLARRAALLQGPALDGVSFEASPLVGGAEADLLVDGTLVDLRVAVRPTPRVAWLRHGLALAMLDTHDRYRIRALGVYLARQGELVRWPLSQVLAETAPAGAACGLRELRGRLARELGAGAARSSVGAGRRAA